MKKLIVLRKQLLEENEVYEDYFVTENRDIPAEQLLRKVSDDFFKTDSGKEAIGATKWDFNWGDFLHYIDQDYLEEYELEEVELNKVEQPWMVKGIKIVDIEVVTVQHDEILIPF